MNEVYVTDKNGVQWVESFDNFDSAYDYALDMATLGYDAGMINDITGEYLPVKICCDGYTINDVEPEELNVGIPDEFIVEVYDRDTYEEFEFTVTKDWLEKYDVDTNDFSEIMEFVEWYFSERNCAIS